jgi:hypothetical protein
MSAGLNALSSSIIECYDVHGMTVDEICKVNDGMEPVIVKSVLLQYSERYRNISKLLEAEGSALAKVLPAQAQEENFVSPEELKGYISSYKMLTHEDDPYLREKVLRNLINVGMKVTDGIGENNPRKLLDSLGGVGNIMALNNILQKAKEAKRAAMINVEKIIDVETVMETA